MRALRGLAVAALILGLTSLPALAVPYEVLFDFDTSWSEDYAPGWENSAYRHGPAPVGKMMEHVAGGVLGSGAMKLIADSTPESWMWWAAVNPIEVHEWAMTKNYTPWVSVDYYDEGWETGSDLHRAGQLYAVPSWVNPYIDGSEDWTDIQFGARMNQGPPNDNYWYVAAGQGSPGWQDTGVDRKTMNAPGWVNLKMQLGADGFVRFYVDNVYKGASYRNDYIDLVGMGLYNMFTDPLSAWGDNKPAVIYDNFRFGSMADVPEPNTVLLLLGCAALGLGARFVRRRK